MASVGGLIFGFDTAVISGTTEQLKAYFDLSDAYLGWAVGMALLGTITGALTAGKPADRYGRKPVLFVIGRVAGLTWPVAQARTPAASTVSVNPQSARDIEPLVSRSLTRADHCRAASVISE